MNSPVGLGVFPTAATPIGFTVGAFDGFFSHTGTLGCSICLAPQLFSWFISMQMWDHPVCQPLPCHLQLLPLHASSPPRLPVSTHPTTLAECFLFNYLVLTLLYSLIFWQFWLFFVSTFVVILFWLCKEAKCIYLCLHFGQKCPLSILKPYLKAHQLG